MAEPSYFAAERVLERTISWGTNMQLFRLAAALQLCAEIEQEALIEVSEPTRDACRAARARLELLQHRFRADYDEHLRTRVTRSEVLPALPEASEPVESGATLRVHQRLAARRKARNATRRASAG